jgi:hypothetical protein
MTLEPDGIVKLGNNSTNPEVYIQGVNTANPPVQVLGRVYDTVYNKPNMSVIGSTSYSNTVTTYQITPAAPTTLCQIATTLGGATEVVVDLNYLVLDGVSAGTPAAFALALYLSTSPTEIYNETTQTNFTINSPGLSFGDVFTFASRSTITLKYYSTSTSAETVYLMAQLFPFNQAALQINITTFYMSALVKASISGNSIAMISAL